MSVRVSVGLTIGCVVGAFTTALVIRPLGGIPPTSSVAAAMATAADEPGPAGVHSGPIEGARGRSGVDLAANSDEQLLIEMRRRALEAEASAPTGSSDDGLPISIADLDAMPRLLGDLGPLPESAPHPDDNAPNPARVELGRRLYFDLRLSRDRTMSCASCHDPELGWADGKPRSMGFGNHELGRHSPTVINAAFHEAQFWDGRAQTLEQQAVGPIMAAGEMNMPSEKSVLEMIRSAPEYEGAFEEAYGGAPSMDNIGRAIASFERQVITGPSRFDRYATGDKDALSDSEKRGLILFMTSASCTACHNGPNLSDGKFHALGVRQEGPLPEDLGRFAVTHEANDRYQFKTPGLRNIEQTAPYMHDGSLLTLEDVVEFYNKGGEHAEFRSDLVKPLNLTDAQQSDLVAFLRSLTGPLPAIAMPKGEYYGK
jgi:cytochrome c peroxidase